MSELHQGWQLMWSHDADGYDCDDTHRMKVPGGWIYRYTKYSADYCVDSEQGSFSVAMVFVPKVHDD